MPDGRVDRWPNGYRHLFFLPKYAQNEGNGPVRTVDFQFWRGNEVSVSACSRYTRDTLISFVPTARLMGSLTTRTYFLRLALIDYRCTKRRIYYKSDKTLEYLTSIVPRDLTLLPLRKNNDSIGEQPVRRYPFIRHPRYIHFRGDITKRQRTRPSRQPI